MHHAARPARLHAARIVLGPGQLTLKGGLLLGAIEEQLIKGMLHAAGRKFRLGQLAVKLGFLVRSLQCSLSQLVVEAFTLVCCLRHCTGLLARTGLSQPVESHLGNRRTW